MRIDDRGLALITAYEGVRLKSYWDPHGGRWTVGYGHTATAQKGMSITQAKAVDLLTDDVSRFEECVAQALTREVTQEQFNALVSFAYNMGCSGIRKSQLLALVNEGRYDDAVAAFGKYVNAGGRRLKGLVKRRDAESMMFASGELRRKGPVNVADTFQWIFGGSVQQLFAKNKG